MGVVNDRKVGSFKFDARQRLPLKNTTSARPDGGSQISVHH